MTLVLCSANSAGVMDRGTADVANCRAVQHRLDEPGQIIPQHGCVPALPASVSPGSENFSRKSTKVVRAAQNQASVIAQRGLEVTLLFSTSGRGRNIFLDFPFYRAGLNT